MDDDGGLRACPVQQSAGRRGILDNTNQTPDEFCADPVSPDARHRRAVAARRGVFRTAAGCAPAAFDKNQARWPPSAVRGASEERCCAACWVEYAASFFPVLLVVFLLRSFVAEPFKIPSSSMRPTLEVGDFILVNKFVYGLRLPIIEQQDRARCPIRSAATSSCSAIR